MANWLRKAGRAARDAANWDPLDLAEDSFDRRNCWDSDWPDGPKSLERYAQQRGLRWNPESNLLTFGCLHAWGEGVNLNTARGIHPNGRYGVLGHQKREHKVQGTGYDSEGGRGGAVTARIREGHTFAATFAPETRRTLVVATAYAAQLGCDPYGVTLEPLENDQDRWRRDLHPLGDRALFDEIWSGPAAERLRASFPWGPSSGLNRRPAPGGKLDVRAGIVSVWAPGFLDDPTQLDSLVELAFAFADELRALCAPHAPGAPFDTPLPPSPGWGAPGKAHDTLAKSLDKAPVKRVRRGLAPRDDLVEPGLREDERWAGLRDFAAGYAAKRGLTLEDGDAFGRAFPALPYTGWAQFAARGALRGGQPFRVALTAQRPFLWQPAFAYGGAVAVAPVRPGTPDQPVRVDDASGCFHAVTGGLHSVARYDTVPNLAYEQMDVVTAELARALG